MPAPQIVFAFFDFGNQVGFSTDVEGRVQEDGSLLRKGERMSLFPSASHTHDHELIEKVVETINKVLAGEDHAN
jgi:hypothetical protein